MDYIENKTFAEIKIGDSDSISRTVSREDIELFAIVSGDVNPAHVDSEYAKHDMFHELIAHGMWGGALISSVLGTKLPGPGTIYLGQTLKFLKPVRIGDTVNATLRVAEKKSEKNIVILNCSCTNQDGKEVITGDATVIAPTEKLKLKKVVLPKIEIKRDANESLCAKTIALAKSMSALITAVVQPIDESSLSGSVEAAKDGLITPILIGNQDRINQAALKSGLDISPYKLIPANDDYDAVSKAIGLVKQGKAEAIMKGALHTDALLGPILNKEQGLKVLRRLSHVFVLDVPSYHKLLFLTDAAINISPDLDEKRDITQNAIDLFQKMGLGVPKVAVISAVETVTEKMQATLDAAALAKMAERGQIRGGLVEGPLAFDNAISKAAAKIKGIVSDVAGDADIIVVPNIETGNALYKETTFLFQVEGAGIVLGTSVPIILTSRADSALTRAFSCAVAVLYARDN
jgi:phosphotransacetylase/acyl dehydratase